MPISYSKTTWVNGSAPAINAANLNKIEDALKAACDFVDGTSRATTFSASDGQLDAITIAGTTYRVKRIFSGSGAPSTSATTTYKSEDLYVDYTNARLYCCLSSVGETVNWLSIGNGGGTTVVANPTLTDANDALDGITIDNTNYRVKKVWLFPGDAPTTSDTRHFSVGDLYVNNTDAYGRAGLTWICTNVTQIDTTHWRAEWLSLKQIISTGTTAPTTSTPGYTGKLYVNTSTKYVYMCTGATGAWTYGWIRLNAIEATDLKSTGATQGQLLQADGNGGVAWVTIPDWDGSVT